MTTRELIEQKLIFLRKFQSTYPSSHVGGSIGLMIRGIDLKRNLSNSDLDITVDSFVPKKFRLMEERSNNSDFDYGYKIEHEDGHYTKIDIRVTPEPSFEVIEFEGHKYNVSMLRDIFILERKIFKQRNHKTPRGPRDYDYGHKTRMFVRQC